jgi:hypothetical protein
MTAQSLGSVKVLVQPEKDSLRAIATDAFSSRSVRTCKSSSAPTEAGYRSLGAERQQEMGRAGAGVPDQAQRLALLDPLALGQSVDDRGIDAGVGLEVEAA